MRQSIKICFFLATITFCIMAYAANNIAPFSTFHEGLRYWGSDPECKKALNHAMIHEKFISNFIPGKKGIIYLMLENPTSSSPPIDTYLFKSGDADRYGFAAYYLPPYPLRINHHAVGLRDIVFNLCLDGQKQSGVVIILPSGTACIMSTHAWNYCR